MSIFSIFTNSNNSFEGEEGDEKVVLLLRRHPFVILIKLLFFAVLIMVPTMIGAFFSPYLHAHELLSAFFFLASIWYLLIWSAAFYTLTMYTLDVWIVTNKRIIDSKQKGFFHRTVAELHLSRIQDISVNTNGFLHTLLKFGDLQVQTAGAEDKFNFLQIPNPEAVKDQIMKLATNHVHP